MKNLSSSSEAMNFKKEIYKYIRMTVAQLTTSGITLNSELHVSSSVIGSIPVQYSSHIFLVQIFTFTQLHDEGILTQPCSQAPLCTFFHTE